MIMRYIVYTKNEKRDELGIILFDEGILSSLVRTDGTPADIRLRERFYLLQLRSSFLNISMDPYGYNALEEPNAR